MDWFAGEPTLEDTLSDPIIRAIMKRDEVEVDRLRNFLKDVSGRLNARRRRSGVAEGVPRQAG
jgi:hypothetical protein